MREFLSKRLSRRRLLGAATTATGALAAAEPVNDFETASITIY